MSEVDEAIARADDLLQRTRERRSDLSARRRAAGEIALKERLVRIAAADVGILVAATLLGWFLPLGIGGAMLVMAALIAATVGFAIFPLPPELKPEAFHAVPLKLLPLRTEQWLEGQRSTLPLAAVRIVDEIGLKLDTLSPQLATLDEAQPAASEIRKLVGEQLPELVKGYQRVPEPLRRVERNGRSPDDQLSYSLKLISDEIAEMTAKLAEGDLDSLTTRGRYIEMRYKDDEV